MERCQVTLSHVKCSIKNHHQHQSPWLNVPLRIIIKIPFLQTKKKRIERSVQWLFFIDTDVWKNDILTIHYKFFAKPRAFSRVFKYCIPVRTTKATLGFYTWLRWKGFCLIFDLNDNKPYNSGAKRAFRAPRVQQPDTKPNVEFYWHVKKMTYPWIWWHLINNTNVGELIYSRSYEGQTLKNRIFKLMSDDYSILV